MNIGTVIKNRREQLGLRQEDLAERTGLARNTISRIEIGAVHPSMQSLKTIAAQLNCSVAVLYQDPEPVPRTIGETLFRAGVRDRTLSLSLAEIRDLFRQPGGGIIGYEDAYTIARQAIAALTACNRELAPYGPDMKAKSLASTARDRAWLAYLEYRAIADEYIDHVEPTVDEADGDRLDMMSRDVWDITGRMAEAQNYGFTSR